MRRGVRHPVIVIPVVVAMVIPVVLAMVREAVRDRRPRSGEARKERQEDSDHAGGEREAHYANAMPAPAP